MASASAIYVDRTHRHIVFTIPEKYRVLFRIDRVLLGLLYIAARNTIYHHANPRKYEKLLKKAKAAGQSVYWCNGGVYLFDNNPDTCVAETLWNPAKQSHRSFRPIDFSGLRMHWKRQLNELLTRHFGSAPIRVDGKPIARFGKDNPTYGSSVSAKATFIFRGDEPVCDECASSTITA